MQLSRQKKGDDKCCFWLELLRDPHRYQGGSGGAATAESVGEIAAGLSQPALGSEFCRAFGISLGAGEPHCKPDSSGESLQKGRGWVGWGRRLSAEDQCPRLLGQESSSSGMRSSSCKQKLEKLK